MLGDGVAVDIESCERAKRGRREDTFEGSQGGGLNGEGEARLNPRPPAPSTPNTNNLILIDNIEAVTTYGKLQKQSTAENGKRF